MKIFIANTLGTTVGFTLALVVLFQLLRKPVAQGFKTSQEAMGLVADFGQRPQGNTAPRVPRDPDSVKVPGVDY